MAPTTMPRKFLVDQLVLIISLIDLDLSFTSSEFDMLYYLFLQRYKYLHNKALKYHYLICLNPNILP